MPQEEMLSEEPVVYCVGEMVEIDKVIPNPMNANVHPDEQIKMLAGILRVNGWREAIVVSKLSGMVVKGHGRLLTAKFLKLKKVPVEYQEYRDEQSELADLIADNRIAQHSYVDALGLGKLLKKLSSKDHEHLGYTQEEVDLFLAAEYVPEVATNRTFQVLETLKMSKESKAVVGHAIQRYCLKLGKEVEWGEALAEICIQWEGFAGVAGMSVEPPPKPKPEPKVKEPKEPKVKAPKAEVKAAEPTATQASGSRLFKIKYVAETMLGKIGVTVIRQQESDVRFYTNDPGIIAAAKLAKEKGYEVQAEVKLVETDFWLESLEKA